MLKKLCLIFIAVALCLPGLAFAGDASSALSQASATFSKAKKNFDLAGMRTATEQFGKAVELDPKSYDALVGLARANAHIGYIANRNQVPGAKDMCRKYGKLGMELAKKAQGLNPNRPDAFFQEAWSISIYSDGVGVLTAVRENLMDRAKNGFQKAYNIDKNYNYGAPILGMARFYQIMPWPVKDNKKSLGYYQEFERLGYLRTDPDRDLALNNYIELMIDMGGAANKAKAKVMLQELNKSESALYRQNAQKLAKSL